MSAQGPLVLGLGLKGLGPGVDNFYFHVCSNDAISPVM